MTGDQGARAAVRGALQAAAVRLYELHGKGPDKSYAMVHADDGYCPDCDALTKVRDADALLDALGAPASELQDLLEELVDASTEYDQSGADSFDARQRLLRARHAARKALDALGAGVGADAVGRLLSGHSPFEVDEEGYEHECHFCGMGNRHSDDCPWMRAEQTRAALAGGEVAGG